MIRPRTANVPATPAADADAPDWAPMLALLDEMVQEDSLEISFRQFAESLERTSYRSITLDEFLERYRANCLAMVAGVRQRRNPGPRDDGRELQATGRSRALGGVELSDIVRVALAAQSTFGTYVSARARATGLADQLTVEMLRYLDAWHAWSMKELIAGFQEAALALVTRDLRRQDRAMRQLLSGGLTPAEIGRAASDCGLDPGGVYRVLRAVTAGRPIAEVRRALCMAGVQLSEDSALTTMYGDVCLVVGEAPRGEVPFVVGISPPVDVSDLAEGFRLATRGADAARQMGRSGFVTMRDLSIMASVAVDHEVVQVLTHRYLDPLTELGPAGQAIIDTVAEFLRRQRSVAETGLALFVHANTVRYRLERFESMTNSSLKDVRTLTEVWWILHSHGH